MFQKLKDKFSIFVGLHPQVTTYAIGIGVTLGIGLALSFVMAPHGVMAILVKKRIWTPTFQIHHGGHWY